MYKYYINDENGLEKGQVFRKRFDENGKEILNSAGGTVEVLTMNLTWNPLNEIRSLQFPSEYWMSSLTAENAYEIMIAQSKGAKSIDLVKDAYGEEHVEVKY